MHVAVHHPLGIFSCFLKHLEVGEHLRGNAEDPQEVDVCVSQHRLLFLQTLTAQLHNFMVSSLQAGLVDLLQCVLGELDNLLHCLCRRLRTKLEKLVRNIHHLTSRH